LKSNARLTTAALAAVLIIAALFRYWDLTAVRHHIDNAYPIWQALDTLDHGTLPVIGQPTSVLFANPVLTGYLFLPVVALTRSALAVYIVVVALNTAGVLFCYLTVRNLTGRAWTGIAAAWLMAVNPWIIEFSRTTWVQCLLPFLMCLTAWLLFPVLQGIARQPAKRLIAALITATVTAHTWLLSFFIALPVAALMLIFRRRLPRRAALVGGALFVAADAVFALGLFANPQAGFSRAGNFSSGTAGLRSEPLLHAVRMVTGSEYTASRGESLPDAAAWMTADNVIHYALLALLIVGVISAFVTLRTPGRDRDAAIIVLLWFFLPVLAMSYNGSPIHPHYMLMTLPAGFALAAWGAEAVARWRPARPALVIGLVAVGLISGFASTRAAHETRLIGGDEALGLPLYAGLRLGDTINAHLPDGGTVFANIEPTILSSLAGRTIPVVLDTRAPVVIIVPQRGGLYITLSQDAAVPQFARPIESFAFPSGRSIQVSAYPSGGIDTASLPNQMNIPSAHGITFCCYDLTSNRRGTRWTLTTYWRIEHADPQASRDAFGSFFRVYDENGARLTQIDGPIVPGYLWNTGDVHVHQARFTVPEGTPFTLGAGLFDADRNNNVQFLLPDGSTAIELRFSDGQLLSP
jgi:4-amino-4-deoxy-L-arabinose transferase-like glycosyltransferase